MTKIGYHHQERGIFRYKYYELSLGHVDSRSLWEDISIRIYEDLERKKSGLEVNISGSL